MSLTPAHLETLEAYGYTAQEAHFLYLVATHSGYFLARQFLGFAHAHWGKRTTRFWNKLQARKHARTECFPSYGLVYHVYARKLYRHLGRENLRNRREHEIEHVERRVAMFDFILTHLDCDYLETDAEKRGYFERTRGIPAQALPSRTYQGQADSEPTVRCFVDGFPMFVENPGNSPVVVFSYIQPAEANLSQFARHLADYLPLFRELPAFRFLYLARSISHFEKARELFDAAVVIPLSSHAVDDLLRYFAIRRAWDLRQYSALSETDLIFRNQAKLRFAAARFDHLYREWKTGRTTDAQVRAEFPVNRQKHAIRFETELLKKVGADAAERSDQG